MLALPDGQASDTFDFARDRLKKCSFVFCKALRFVEMTRLGLAFRIIFDLAPVLLISLDCRKAEQRDGDITRTVLANSREAKRRRRRSFMRDEVSMMSATILFDQTHPDPRILLEVRQLFRIQGVTNKAGNQF